MTTTTITFINKWILPKYVKHKFFYEETFEMNTQDRYD